MERTGTAAKLGGCVRDERRREYILGPVGHPPDARGDIVLWQFILPKTERAAILRQLHDEPMGGNLGRIKTLGKVR